MSLLEALGTLAGGALGQVGEVMDTPRRLAWQAAADALGTTAPESGAELLGRFGMNPENPWTKALGFGAEMALDPLSYAGGLAGRLGRYGAGTLEKAALARGPQYPGGLEKLAGIQSPVSRRVFEETPEIKRLLQEIPPGSRYLGEGMEGVAFRTPSDDVVRIGGRGFGNFSKDWPASPPLSRVTIPEVLQPTRNVEIGQWRAERTPLADTSHIRDGVSMPSFREDKFGPDFEKLKRDIINRGYQPEDLHVGNVGRVGGELRVIDPGSVVPKIGGPSAFAPSIQASDPSRLTRWMLDRMGADDMVRRRLEGQSPTLIDRLLKMASI